MKKVFLSIISLFSVLGLLFVIFADNFYVGFDFSNSLTYLRNVFFTDDGTADGNVNVLVNGESGEVYVANKLGVGTFVSSGLNLEVSGDFKLGSGQINKIFVVTGEYLLLSGQKIKADEAVLKNLLVTDFFTMNKGLALGLFTGTRIDAQNFVASNSIETPKIENLNGDNVLLNDSLIVSKKLGIGVINPQKELEISGNVKIGSGSLEIKKIFYKNNGLDFDFDNYSDKDNIALLRSGGRMIHASWDNTHGGIIDIPYSESATNFIKLVRVSAIGIPYFFTVDRENKRVGIGKNGYPYYTLDVSGDTKILGKLGVGTSPMVGKDLNVGGDSNFGGDVKVNGYLYLSKGLGVSGVTGDMNNGVDNETLPTTLAVKNYVDNQGFLKIVDWEDIQNGSNVYMRYKPNNSACSTNQVLKWDGSKWICGNDIDTDTNNYVTSVSFDTGNGVLTLNRNGLSPVTANLDGRYVKKGQESDPIFMSHSGDYYTKSESDSRYLSSESDPKVGSLTSSYIPKWDGSKLVNSAIIDNNGNIGIGVSPSYKLDVAGDIKVGSNRKLYLGGTDVYLSDDSGNLGIAGVSSIVIKYDSDDNGYGLFILKSGPDTVISSNSVGNVAIGGSYNNSYKLLVYGNIKATGGSMYADTFYYNSDIRLKTGLQVITGALDKIMKLTGYYFSRKSSPDSKNIGVIAQQVQKVFPEVVGETKGSGGYLTVEYGNLVAPLIEAVKELKRENDSLKQQINDMEKEMNEIKKDIEALKKQKSFRSFLKFN